MQGLQISIPPLPRFAAKARSALSTFAGCNRIDPLDLENLTFALGEAIANAIQHAETADDIVVRARLQPDAIVVTVSDQGRGFNAPPEGRGPLPSVFAEAGRGFAIMQLCTDFLDVASAPGQGTVVTLGRYRPKRQELQAAS